MNSKQAFIRLMDTQTEIALATCVDGQPNVRVVNFYFDAAANMVLFSTFGDNEKVKDFDANNKVAFTTIPHEGIEHIKAKGTIQKVSAPCLMWLNISSKKYPVTKIQ